MRVVWLRKAEHGLEDIADYIALDNPRAAHETIAKIRRAGNNLADLPHTGRPGRITGTRELIILGTPYLISYRVRETQIQVLRVLHSKHRWPKSF